MSHNEVKSGCSGKIYYAAIENVENRSDKKSILRYKS